MTVREPAGKPTGGQFAAVARPEGNISIAGTATLDRENMPDVTVQDERISLDLTYIGEGYEGDFDPTDIGDEPLYRFHAARWNDVDREWEPVEGGSWCTNLPTTTDPELLTSYLNQQLARAAAKTDDELDAELRTIAREAERATPESIAA